MIHIAIIVVAVIFFFGGIAWAASVTASLSQIKQSLRGMDGWITRIEKRTDKNSEELHKLKENAAASIGEIPNPLLPPKPGTA